MISEKKPNVTFSDLQRILHVRLLCNCTVANDGTIPIQQCVCTTPCYCRVSENKLVNGVVEYIKTGKTDIVVGFFKELEELSRNHPSFTVTLLDCAKFLHHVNTHESELKKLINK